MTLIEHYFGFTEILKVRDSFAKSRFLFGNCKRLGADGQVGEGGGGTFGQCDEGSGGLGIY